MEVTSWQDIQAEIESAQKEINQRSEGARVSGFDIVRRKKYELLKNLTGRPLLVYATAFHHPIKAKFSDFLTIDISDKEGFDEIIRNITSQEVDVFVHSPGGSAEATESIVKMLRSKFREIRFIVTGAAKSAATMLVLSGDSILMSSAGELGPIDPQVMVRGRFCPAGSILEQFDRAAAQLREDPSLLPVWLPILQEFAPSLLVECENFIKLSEELVINWLTEYMFRGLRDARRKAEKVAKYLAEEHTLSHSRRVDAEQLKKLGVRIELLEEREPPLQDAIRQVHLSIMATLDGTDAVKIFENSEGAALIRMLKIQPTLPQQPI
ncbi:MAG: SDH family Clp fold serine proteinase [bacterium]